MPGKFVVKKGSSGKFHFNLLASNGQVIATSEAYETKRACLNGIDSVRKNAPTATVDDQRKTLQGGRSLGLPAAATSPTRRDASPAWRGGR